METRFRDVVLGQHDKCFPSQALALPGCLPDPRLQRKVSSVLREQDQDTVIQNTVLSALLMPF